VVAADAGPAGPGAPVAVPGRDPLDRAAETLRAVLGPEGPGGVRLVLRTAAGTAVDSLLRASEAVRRVAHPAFGILLDPAELVTLDTYHDNPSFLRRAAAQLGSALWGCTARDVLLVPDGFAYRLEVAPLGAGALDYPGLLAEMARLPGDVPVCVAGPATEAEAALRHLRQVLDRAAARD
jgi:sugar phosphate isomerase/epimerase